MLSTGKSRANQCKVRKGAVWYGNIGTR